MRSTTIYIQYIHTWLPPHLAGDLAEYPLASFGKRSSWGEGLPNACGNAVFSCSATPKQVPKSALQHFTGAVQSEIWAAGARGCRWPHAAISPTGRHLQHLYRQRPSIGDMGGKSGSEVTPAHAPISPIEERLLQARFFTGAVQQGIWGASAGGHLQPMPAYPLLNGTSGKSLITRFFWFMFRLSIDEKKNTTQANATHGGRRYPAHRTNPTPQDCPLYLTSLTMILLYY